MMTKYKGGRASVLTCLSLALEQRDKHPNSDMCLNVEGLLLIFLSGKYIPPGVRWFLSLKRLGDK